MSNKYHAESHTPGPWTTGWDAKDMDPRMEVTIGFTREASPVGELRERHEANLRLVAAAPDLFAACLRLREALLDPQLRDATAACWQADAVIAKARGQ